MFDADPAEERDADDLNVSQHPLKSSTHRKDH